MKKIEAVIRLTKFEEVKEALAAQNITFFSYWDVRGVGMTTEEHMYRGTKFDSSIIERRLLSIIVRDINVDITVKALVDTAKTGEKGDGRIFISDITDTVRIRTGESGPDTLFEK